MVPRFYSAKDIAFDFGELVDEAYPSGEWSVDELEKKYGVADEIRGSLDNDDDLYIGIDWAGFYVLMRSARDGAMSFDTAKNRRGFYPLAAPDRSIRIQVQKIHFSDESLPLPRLLRIGQSTIEQVKSAYPEDTGDEVTLDTVTVSSIAYRYLDFDYIAGKEEIGRSDIGYIKYYMDDEILCAVEIGWIPA